MVIHGSRVMAQGSWSRGSGPALGPSGAPPGLGLAPALPLGLRGPWHTALGSAWQKAHAWAVVHIAWAVGHGNVLVFDILDIHLADPGSIQESSGTSLKQFWSIQEPFHDMRTGRGGIRAACRMTCASLSKTVSCRGVHA